MSREFIGNDGSPPLENPQIVRVSKREREGGREIERERERGRGSFCKRQRILP